VDCASCIITVCKINAAILLEASTAKCFDSCSAVWLTVDYSE